MTIVFSGGNNRSPNDTRILSVDINRVRNIQDEVKLSGRDLATIPEYVRRNIHLRILDLSNNSLGRAEDVVSELCDLKNLTRLNLSVNELKNIPLDFTSFPFLEVLCLAGNELEYLPEGITSLHRKKAFGEIIGPIKLFTRALQLRFKIKQKKRMEPSQKHTRRENSRTSKLTSAQPFS
ncbi:uncharacterized protein TNCT_606022 [Trichonephila clavata]|uniref:Leucine-rich repeat protein n=1 Tax=Trichonephila clavata TaxID=2740835 RepID=A0A8X6LBE9_TRICU|nr:uncharacterized protein TNCT_606022 [Trichonephila clavata]